MKKVILFLLVLILNSHEVSAASASGTGTIAARIVAAVSVDETKTLKFGTMTGDAGVVSIGLTGDRTSTGANLVEDSTNPPSNGEMLIYGPINQVVYIDHADGRTSTSQNLVSDSNTPKSGQITITGPKGHAITIGVPATTSVQLQNGSATMPVTDLNLDSTSGTLDATTGKMTVKVGGKLGVADNQEEGDYHGTYTITVTY